MSKQADDSNFVWRPYCQMKTAEPPIEIVATQGVHLSTPDGRHLIDAMASWWSVCHGYNHPHIVAAVEDQLRRMPHVMFGGLTHEPAERLASRLAALLPGDLQHVFFADSGSVAIEVAMKMTLGYWRRHNRPQRRRFLSFENAYHGDTTGAMSLCDPFHGMHNVCTGAILDQLHAPLPTDDSSIEQFRLIVHQHHEEIAAVVVEPLVQGAAGMRFHDAETIRRIDCVCKEYGLLLVIDEIATGFGRTGTMFAIDQIGIVPDVVCLGKALTAGTMTMAVAVANHRVFEAFWSDDRSDALMHGPTFMANPLACAAANASLDLFEIQSIVGRHSTTTDGDSGRLAVPRIEALFRDQLAECRDWPGVVDVRVKGAIGVIEVQQRPSAAMLRKINDRHNVWLRPLGNCIYATPPLIILPPEIEMIVASMKDLATLCLHDDSVVA